jgi:hypothetical protein
MGGSRPTRRILLFVLFVWALAVQNAWCAVTLDAIVSQDQTQASRTVTTAPFSTTSGNQLLLAFVAADFISGTNTTVAGVSGGGLTWTLVRRTNVQSGTAEIWRAFAVNAQSAISVTATLSQAVDSLLTVMSFSGIDTTGAGSGAIGATASGNAASGAPSASLVTTRAGSLVLGVGNDYDRAISRTPGTGQVVVHEFLAPVGDTYWVQRQSAPTTVAGATVTINDLSPTGDRYNLALVEVVPPVTGGGTTFTISGSITPAASGDGATVALSQAGSTVATATADASGIYSFTGRANGAYAVTPAKSGFTFTPASRNVTVNGANVSVPAFTATAVQALTLAPDLQNIIPVDRFSIAQTSAGREFRYTHDIFNAGPGPLVIQPQYNPASGTYSGTQYLYTLSPAGAWTVSRTIPIAGEFFWHAEHGHFHFPLASFGLYAVAPNGGPGAAVAISPKIGFCIDDSYIYDSTIPNAGALGNLLGSCSDPTTLRGLSIGAVDEYDRSDPGQSIPIDGVPDGTYWFRAIVDPDNFLADSDKTNNETDVLLRIANSTVQVLGTSRPVVSTPPQIALTSPLNATTVSGSVQMAATTATGRSVRFLLDGRDFPGNVAAAAPYALSWDTTSVANGAHWIAAQTTDATGVAGTSAVAIVDVLNTTGSRPIVQIESPAAGSIMSSTVNLYATVASSLPISSVTFYVDSVALGVPITAPPPYLLAWNSTSVANGPHVFSAAATDTAGTTSTSPPITATVDNSHPPKLIGKDVTVAVDGADAMTTAAFSTAVADDLLVAFVSYDGPTDAPQAATVSGAGLTWTLLVRSNTQAGTSEIWGARASGLLSRVSVTSRPGVAGFHGSMTVVTFTNAAGTSVVGRAGAPSGAPSIYLPGVIAGDWVFAVGNDWDRAVARVPASGQVLVHQRVDTQVGDTFWVQSTSTPSSANGIVQIGDVSPSNDRWNLASVEIVAARQ